jgi:hypothetical protein
MNARNIKQSREDLVGDVEAAVRCSIAEDTLHIE